ncbi:MAG: hypothetical protein K0S65_1620, partial [Labilithrix sp.]|nr:hypothetical protein [Labilithrix sp.]
GNFGNVDAGDIDAGCTGVVCSRDLHAILDCDGNIVEECGADKACGKGKCVAPCEAAALNEGSVGCSFVVPKQNPIEMYRGSCAAVFVANNWTSPATIRLEYKGEEPSLEDAVWVPYADKDGSVKHRKLDGPIPPGGGAVVFLSSEINTDNRTWIGCPLGAKRVFDKAEGAYSTGFGHVVFAHADVPVSMYSIYPYGGAQSHYPSATLLLPTTSFRTNYIAMSTWGGKGDSFTLPDRPMSEEYPGVQVGTPTLQIVASEDDTSVELLPTVKIVGGNGVAPGEPKEVARYTLQRGEFLQLAQPSELVGSVIESSKPVGLFGGNLCVDVPSNAIACDTDNEQLPPMSAWGNEYAVVPAPNRVDWASQGASIERDPGILRIVGAADGTTLSYEPYPPEGAPDTLESGQHARFVAGSPFVVRSQDESHPFHVTSLMTGAIVSSSGLGDPEMVVVVPPAQWLDSYVFFSDSTYQLSAVVVTRRKDKGQFHDVTLDCAGPLTGWKPINADYESTRVELSRYGKPVPYATGECSDGAHRIQSTGPFTITVWGVSAWASYAYAGGMGLRTLSDVHVPAVVH